MSSEPIEEVRAALQVAEGVVVLTGAGVSAESGVPTFRDPGGIWSRFRPEDLATPAAFARDPRTVWEWYDYRRRAVMECDPNPGHTSLARFLLARADVTLVTQNVDGLHQRALESEVSRDSGRGDRGSRILELHGNLLRVRCTGCGDRSDHRDPIDTKEVDSLPRCSDCGELLRPDVVWFGEFLDTNTLDAAFRAAGSAKLCLVVGTSAVVHPAASVPAATLEGGGDIIEVNPERTPLTAKARWTFRAPSGEILPRILQPFI